MIVFAISYDPFNEGVVFIHGRLLHHRTFEVIIVAVATVLVLWLFECILRHSKSKTRFTLTILASLITPFILAMLFFQFADFTIKRDPEKVQELRFGESGIFLKNADKIELHSLHPPYIEEKKNLESLFHNYKIMGSIEINDQSDIETIWKDLESRIYSGHGSAYTECFSPRHGIRAYQDDAFKDYLICFQCHHIYVFDTADGEHKRIGLEGEKGNRLLNDILDKAGIERDRPQ